MQAIVIDFSRQSPETFADVPELEARIRTLQLVRRAAELQFDSVRRSSSDSCHSGGKSLRTKRL
jgi:hypothetical protein